jgi:hypothetical protein
MRALVLFAVALLGLGCEEVRNPEVCCSNAVECDQFGFDEITPCEGFLVCVGGSCESPTCTRSSDCTNPNAPYCVDTVCVAACSGDQSCVGAAGGELCGPDGACVECLDDAQCEAAAPVCDDATRSCRGCVEDSECASGICLAAEGVCWAEADAVFVSDAGTDTGSCTAATPCATVEYGLTQVTSARRVLRLPAANHVEVNGTTITRDVYIDAAGTRLQSSDPLTPIVTVSGQARVTFEGIRIISGSGNGDALRASAGSTVTLYAATIEDAIVKATGFGSRVEVRRSSFAGLSGGVVCDSQSALDVRESDFDGLGVDSDTCELVVVGNRFRRMDVGPEVHARNTQDTLIENNIFEVVGMSQGTFVTLNRSNLINYSVVFRFNTMKQSSPMPGRQLVSCYGPSGPVFSSNVVLSGATGTFSNKEGSCSVDHNVFDDESGLPTGTANVSAPAEEIVVDLAGGDYHLAPASVAIGAADPAQVSTVDYDGAARPMPAGTTADAGAFESP